MAIKLGNEGKVLLALAVITLSVMGFAAAAADENDEQHLNGSTYSSRSGGAKATYTLIEEMGYPIERWSKSPSALPEDAENTLLVIAVSQRRATDEDRVALNRFLARGGTLLIAGPMAGGLVPELRPMYELPSKSWISYGAQVPHPLNHDVSAITMPKGWHLDPSQGDVPLYGDSEKTVAMLVHRGKGRIVWLASAVPLCNAGLKAKGNAEFLGNVLALAASRRVLWDLYFSEDAPGKHSPFRVPALMVGSAQLLFIFGLIVFTHSRRSGPERAFAEGPQPMSQMEFVDTLASVYQTAKASNVSVQIVYARFAYLAARRFGTSSTNVNKLGEFVAHATGERSREVTDFLTECDNIQHHAKLTNQQAMERVQRLHGYLLKLKLIPDPNQEKL
jgi:hypothetical protein